METKLLEEARLALKVIGSVFIPAKISQERIIIFAGIVKNQSVKMGIDWKTLLRQYEDLSYEIYDRKPTNRDFFEQTRAAIESKAYEVLWVH